MQKTTQYKNQLIPDSKVGIGEILLAVFITYLFFHAFIFAGKPEIQVETAQGQLASGVSEVR